VSLIKGLGGFALLFGVMDGMGWVWVWVWVWGIAV
jgi:hypothetical protein